MDYRVVNSCLRILGALVLNQIRYEKVVVLTVCALLAGCGGDSGSSSSGGGSSQSSVANDSATETAASPGLTGPIDTPTLAPVPAVTTPRVGPNLAGTTWVGYFKDRKDAYEPVTASITHEGDLVIIRTSKASGVARVLSGRITSRGNMLLFDTFDREDWTTLFGAASTNSINLADYVKVGSERVNTNILILKRQ
ncbi:MAG: hypothetical protein ACI8P9_001443 [Parasphingorhabdus sp.]|jgi:hypothetical protein